ncbi:unnamed protein product [Amoebophrya sp. A25]|nr:unnamed protein product [Amoebophrya sp. A25]|eukprot:GSA25T00009658001.1
MQQASSALNVVVEPEEDPNRSSSSTTSPPPCTCVTVDQVARIALNYLLHEKGFVEEDVILFGRSIGTGPASRLAGRSKKAFHAVILQSPYCSIESIAAEFPFGNLISFDSTHWDNAAELEKALRIGRPPTVEGVEVVLPSNEILGAHAGQGNGNANTSAGANAEQGNGNSNGSGSANAEQGNGNANGSGSANAEHGNGNSNGSGSGTNHGVSRLQLGQGGSEVTRGNSTPPVVLGSIASGGSSGSTRRRADATLGKTVVCLIHGRDDSVIPVPECSKLYTHLRKLAPECVSCKVLDEKNHNDLEWSMDVQPMVERFLRRKRPLNYEKIRSFSSCSMGPRISSDGSRRLSSTITSGSRGARHSYLGPHGGGHGLRSGLLDNDYGGGRASSSRSKEGGTDADENYHDSTSPKKFLNYRLPGKVKRTSSSVNSVEALEESLGGASFIFTASPPMGLQRPLSSASPLRPSLGDAGPPVSEPRRASLPSSSGFSTVRKQDGSCGLIPTPTSPGGPTAQLHQRPPLHDVHLLHRELLHELEDDREQLEDETSILEVGVFQHQQRHHPTVAHGGALSPLQPRGLIPELHEVEEHDEGVEEEQTAGTARGINAGMLQSIPGHLQQESLSHRISMRRADAARMNSFNFSSLTLQVGSAGGADRSSTNNTSSTSTAAPAAPMVVGEATIATTAAARNHQVLSSDEQLLAERVQPSSFSTVLPPGGTGSTTPATTEPLIVSPSLARQPRAPRRSPTQFVPYYQGTALLPPASTTNSTSSSVGQPHQPRLLSYSPERRIGSSGRGTSIQLLPATNANLSLMGGAESPTNSTAPPIPSAALSPSQMRADTGGRGRDSHDQQ